jgi:hypothetical protein
MSNGFPRAEFRNTPAAVVVPFYLYAAAGFLFSTILLLLSAGSFTHHYFNPAILAITHGMALGWATMIIMGASYQLLPVLTERSLWSVKGAQLSFILAATGIPLLVYGFYTFNMGWPAKWGGRLVLLGILVYLVNIAKSSRTGKKLNIHALFMTTAAAWLFITAFLGLALVYNFTWPFLPENVLVYLPLHAHAGLLGWFLLLIMGVGSRLIPMFLISKHEDRRILKIIYGLVNGGLLFFLFSFYLNDSYAILLPALLIGSALVLFARYIYQVWKSRIRKKVDQPMQVSLLSVAMMLVPLFCLVLVSGWWISSAEQSRVVLLYGFIIFFGWLTSIILGMTFKTLPFIIWNKCYHDKAGLVKTPDPKELLSATIFKWMSIVYLPGFLLFSAGILLVNLALLQSGAIGLILAALLYNLNVCKVWLHKPIV